MANIRDGYLDYCEHTRGPHEWDPRDTHNVEKNNGPCYNCTEFISMSKYHKCLNCFRNICGTCDYNTGLSASKSFVQTIAKDPPLKPF